MQRIIIVTGTPGVGKTALARLLANKTQSILLNLGELVRTEKLYRRYDRSRQSYVMDEQRVHAFLSKLLESYRRESVVIETHWLGRFMPKSRGMVAIVVRLDPAALAKRLKARKWPKQKIWENVESELVDLSLYESVRFLGPRRVYQIDCTGKSPAQMLQKALRLLSAKQAWDGQTPDWLGRHDPIELSRSIL